MIEPDLTDRQTCCGAPQYHHWEDCPTQVERIAAQHRREERARIRYGHSLMRVGCQCGVCLMASAGHL